MEYLIQFVIAIVLGVALYTLYWLIVRYIIVPVCCYLKSIKLLKDRVSELKDRVDIHYSIINEQMRTHSRLDKATTKLRDDLDHSNQVYNLHISKFHTKVHKVHKSTRRNKLDG